jgi:LacI family transcriptional regulator
MEGMTEAGLTVSADQIAQGFFTYRSGLEAAERLLTNGFHPTAIFACNDDMAAATMAVAHRKGMDVPRDLAIAGFDDTPLASMIWPELTTVRRPLAEMAREAVRLLLEQVKAKRAGKTLATEHKLLGFTLVKRESTSPAPARRKKA